MARIVRSKLTVSRIALRKLFSLLVIARVGVASEPSRQIYVVNTKPPSVSIIDSEGLKVVGRIPLVGDPSYAVTDRQGRFLYVVLNGRLNLRGEGPTVPSELAILDMGARKQFRTIRLGWYADPCSLVSNQRYLLCFSGGFPGMRETPEDFASVKIIDAETNETTATLSAGHAGKQMIFTSDASKIFVLVEESPPLKAAVIAFSPEREKPLAEIALEHEPAQMVLSSDEKWLYILDEGIPSKEPKRARSGVVYVVDVTALKLVASHNVATAPRGLEVDSRTQTAIVMAENNGKDRVGQVYQLRGADLTLLGSIGREPLFVKRLSDQSGRFLFSYEETCFVPDDSPLASPCIRLNRKKGGSTPGTDFEPLNGYPWEVVYLPAQKKVALSVWPTSKVAFVSLKENRVERIVTSGRSSVKVGKTLGAAALAGAMSYMRSYPLFLSLRPVPNPRLKSSPDGRFVYALNTFSGDITIVDSDDYSIIDRIPVGEVHGLLDAPGGKYICTFGPKRIFLIDTQTNKIQADHKLASGKFNNLYMDEPGRRIFAMASNALLVWDAEKGSLVTAIEGFAEPYLVVDPRAHSPLR